MDNDPLADENFPVLGGSPVIRNSRIRKKTANTKGGSKKANSEENVLATQPKVAEDLLHTNKSEALRKSLENDYQSQTSDHGDITPSPIENNAEAIPSENIGEQINFEERSTLPINVKEKIVICIDTFEDPEGTPFVFSNGKMFKTLTMIKRISTLFLKLKKAINCNHEFALIELDGESATWVNDFTTDTDEIISAIKEIVPNTRESTVFDLTRLFDIIQEKAPAPEISEDSTNLPPFITRVIVAYSRSQSVPQFTTGKNSFETWSGSLYSFVDVLYIHENADNDNDCEKIYEALRCLGAESSYLFQVARSASVLHNCMAKLLAHPLQRLGKNQSTFKVEGIDFERNGMH